jgi:hypothetical protein
MDCNCSYIKKVIKNDKDIAIYELYFCINCYDTKIDECACCHNPNVIKIHTEFSNGTVHKRDFCLNCYKIWNNYKKQKGEKLYFLNNERTVKAREINYSFFIELQELNSQYRKKHYELLNRQRISEWRLNYETYLNSGKWKEIRKIILERDQYICQMCKINDAVQVHHLTYKRLGNEQLFDLISVCLDCHNKEHNQ